MLSNDVDSFYDESSALNARMGHLFKRQCTPQCCALPAPYRRSCYRTPSAVSPGTHSGAGVHIGCGGCPEEGGHQPHGRGAGHGGRHHEATGRRGCGHQRGHAGDGAAAGVHCARRKQRRLNGEDIVAAHDVHVISGGTGTVSCGCCGCRRFRARWRQACATRCARALSRSAARRMTASGSKTASQACAAANCLSLRDRFGCSSVCAAAAHHVRQCSWVAVPGTASHRCGGGCAHSVARQRRSGAAVPGGAFASGAPAIDSRM
jgi:hypothetical protein